MSGPGRNLTLTDDDVRMEARHRLQEALDLKADGYAATPAMLVDVLLHAAASGQSIEASTNELCDAASGNTVREKLNERLTVERLDDLERDLNGALIDELPRRVRRAKLEIAIDEHEQPFYGKDPELLALTHRSRAKAGTKQFFRIATAYAIVNGARFTLALTFIHGDDTLVDVLDVLIRRVRARDLRITRLWLDRGYEGVPIYEHLDRLAVPTVLACPIRGKRGGTRGLCKGRGSYSTHHTFKSAKHGTYRARIEVVRVFRRDKEGRRKGEWMVFVQIGGELSPHQVGDRYRTRFGIETSFRTMRQFRIRTNTSNGALRFVYLAIALILVNVWTMLKFLCCQIPRQGRGGRPLDHDRLTLQRVASFLRLAIGDTYGVVRSIDAIAKPIGL